MILEIDGKDLICYVNHKTQVILAEGPRHQRVGISDSAFLYPNSVSQGWLGRSWNSTIYRGKT